MITRRCHHQWQWDMRPVAAPGTCLRRSKHGWLIDLRGGGKRPLKILRGEQSYFRLDALIFLTFQKRLSRVDFFISKKALRRGLFHFEKGSPAWTFSFQKRLSSVDFFISEKALRRGIFHFKKGSGRGL